MREWEIERRDDGDGEWRGRVRGRVRGGVERGVRGRVGVREIMS